ncbi:hypothetical protein AVEN_18116-1 [Araneus ventricosus]|uniref:Uncharacterized protein n=1 Tax=Araneus ventricosus TaxID=182803 RepID=A0A4Y2AIC1_ARAVE|nr:hypothetical protein AVEN_18116-1 [Araneus ventricosus]
MLHEIVIRCLGSPHHLAFLSHNTFFLQQIIHKMSSVWPHVFVHKNKTVASISSEKPHTRFKNLIDTDVRPQKQPQRYGGAGSFSMIHLLTSIPIPLKSSILLMLEEW